MRAIYGEELTPQECYDLAEDWPDYADLLGGTSWEVVEWYYEPDGTTTTCFILRTPPEFDDPFHTCVNPDDFVTLPGCPEAEYKKSAVARFIQNSPGPSPCPCLTDTPVPAVWQALPGAWGSWVAVWETCSGGPVSVTFTPYGVSDPYVDWSITVTTYDGNSETQGTWTCGQWPGPNVAHIMSGPCPFADVSVLMSDS